MEQTPIYAIILAAGSGSRMGAAIPKQFLRLDGKTILQRSIERIHESIPEAKIITVLSKEYFKTWKEICAADSLDCPQVLVAGGITRFQSVRNALKKVPDGAIVLIHDGVRPFISGSKLNEMLAKMDDAQALIPTLALTDTIRWKEACGIELDRSKIISVQTPQFFHSELIKKAYDQAYRLSYTDDASVAESYGVEIKYTSGERYNIKLTTVEDLALAEFILKSQRK